MPFMLAGAALAESDAKMERFVTDLMSKMTLQEKIGQLNLQPAGEVNTGNAMDTNVGHLVADGKVGAILNLIGKDRIRALQKVAVEKSRLGIPLLVGLDVIHGYWTILPIPLAQSCSWDIEGIEAGARMAASEATSDGISWTFSPMVDIALDARWGRIAEGAGEDPYLGSLIAPALVRGYQGDFSKPTNMMACMKHFALYGASETGIDYNYVDMSHLRMFNQYFPPYKAAVQAGVGSVMSSFNLVDGTHATANRWLLTDVLRRMWGFGGFLVTDYGSIGEMANYGLADLKEASAMALQAGTDMDMCSLGFIGKLEESLREGRISEADIDRACRRVLEAKYKLGLFDNPYKHCSLSDEEFNRNVFNAENRQQARRFAAETFVLLKNQGNILPLRKQGKIALIGPNANTHDGLLGTWCFARPASNRYPTLLDAMRQAVGRKAEILYAQGCNLATEREMKGSASPDYIARVDDEAALSEAMEVAAKADVIVCAMGEGADMSGESKCRTNLDLPATQMRLLRQLATLGKPIVLLNFSGRPTTFGWEKDNIPAIMNVWFGGTEAGLAISDVLFGDAVPGGHLTTSLPKTTGQEPLYYNNTNKSRPSRDDDPVFHQYSSNWLDVSNGPAFPFGYGLSYTTFSYGKMQVTASGHNVQVSVDVTNTGSRDAHEVVQCYIRDILCRYARPVKELKGFQRVFIRSGETRTVTISLNEESFSYYDFDGKLFFEPGEFDIMIGPNSRDVQTKRITL